MFRRLRARLRYRAFSDDVAEELRMHREMATREKLQQGAPAREAEAAARRALGNELHAQEEVRAVWIAPRLESVVNDVRLAFRQLRRAPVFTVTALLIVGLSVGGVTTVFGLIDAVLLQPPPYPQAHRIVALTLPDGGANDGAIYHVVRERVHTLSAIAAQGANSGWNLTAGGRAEYVNGQRVSRDIFKVLGVAPMLGREFSEAEDQANGPLTVILSERVWANVFERRPEIVGQVIQLGGTSHEVVGVMPEGFTSTPAADLWTPLRLSPRDNTLNYAVLGRLAEQQTIAQAQAELATIVANLPPSFTDGATARARLYRWMSLQERLRIDRSTPLMFLLLAVVAVAAIACTNLAGLQLLRTLARGHEMATRIAVGGSAGRIVQQLLIDALVLACLGGIAGVTFAWLTLPLLASELPPELLMGRQPVVSATVLLMALTLTLTVGCLFGSAPVLSAFRLDLRAALNASSVRQGSTRTAAWLRRLLLAGEVALTVALLVVAGLLVRTVLRMQGVELGFEPKGVTVAQVSLQGRTFEDPSAVQRLVGHTLQALHQSPGVTNAAVANHVPVERGLNLPLAPPRDSRVTEVRSVDWRYVTSEYFDLLGITVRSGRAFQDSDRIGDAPVAVVNEAFARAYFGNAGVIGRSISLLPVTGDVAREIVGVVADVRSGPGAGWTRGLNALGADAPPTIYVPLAQVPGQILSMTHRFFPVKWIVRANGALAEVSREIERSVRSADGSLAIVRFVPLTQIVADDMRLSRLLATLLAAFALIALLVACTGIYGLVAYAASRRMREVAVRVVLGASRRALLQTLLNETLFVAASGAIVGLALAAAIARVVAGYLAGTAPLDPVTLCFVLLMLLAAISCASVLPALRAIRVDPMRALRME
jgi:putative ABC transport system permease protein